MQLQEQQNKEHSNDQRLLFYSLGETTANFYRRLLEGKYKDSGGVNVLSDISCKLHSTKGKKKHLRIKLYPKKKSFLFLLHPLITNKFIIVGIKSSSLWEYLSVFIWALFIPLYIIYIKKSYSKSLSAFLKYGMKHFGR